MLGTKVSRKRRVGRAALVLVFNAALWILLPSLIGGFLAQALPSTPLAVPEFIYAFGAVITGLQVLGALTEGMALSVPFTSGAYVVSAYYIWAATGGGYLPLSAAGINIVLAFQPLVFLIMLPSLFSAIRVPITFLLEKSEVARPMSDEF